MALEQTRESEKELRLAEVWQKRGRVERAIEGYRRVLELEPEHALAHVQLGDLLFGQKRVAEALEVCARGLETHPNEARLHKGITNALIEQDGIGAAFAYYALERADPRAIQPERDEVLCCAVVRNEALRLPFWLDYYRERGIAKFFIVDNGSTDETLALLLHQPDVYVWESSLAFHKANFGSAWFELLLRCYSVNHWWLMVDADELLYYPDYETQSIPQLCRTLERDKKHALNAVLLDMYAETPIRETHYNAGQDFREVCAYFDGAFYNEQYAGAGPYRNQTAFTGGMRARAFGERDDFYLSKVPLLKYDTNVILAGGQHWTNIPADEISAARGCLLHFKYFSTFPDYVAEEIKRREHADGAWQYTQYANALEQDPALRLYNPAYSVKLRDSAQLVELGIMATGESETTPAQITFPHIPPMGGGSRPFWSVMVTTYERTEFLEAALTGVLAQAPDANEMEIVVVNDGAGEEIQAQIREIVRRCGDGRVEFYATARNVGQPEIFNVCVERARGEWVHIVHDDDWVGAGFYARLREGIAAEPSVGAAFARQVRHGGTGEVLRTSWLERETAGVIDDWLERIAVECRLQPSSVVVRRAVYEAAGGYCAEAGSAFDWEMWKRIAANYPVWYEPQALAHYRAHRGALSYELQRSGRQLQDTRRAIEISKSYLRGEQGNSLTRRAYRNYARIALAQARDYLHAGDAQAALANIRQGLLCSQGDEIQAALVALLTECEGAR